MGFLDVDQARALAMRHPAVRAGDVIVTPLCLAEDAHDRLLETYRLTNPD